MLFIKLLGVISDIKFLLHRAPVTLGLAAIGGSDKKVSPTRFLQ